ncbi:MAG: entericidin A/B family lipoprotein [Sphingomonas sp.]|nr:entericidin A/B family lipoprotein [Sphingomicrobium marinum]NNC48350.1 entericidin A/B family lipoprotein [Sphingomonas sp.]RZV51779.1 MAG: entericidin A/B family lipoprotein [Sphingomonadaceae bacterium]
MVRKFMMLFAAAGLTFGAAACNTVQGVGEDISSAGECGEDVLDGRDC